MMGHANLVLVRHGSDNGGGGGGSRGPGSGCWDSGGCWNGHKNGESLKQDRVSEVEPRRPYVRQVKPLYPFHYDFP